MARLIISAIVLIAIFFCQARLEAVEDDTLRTLDDYKNDINTTDLFFVNKNKLLEGYLPTLRQKVQNNLTSLLSIYTSIHKETFSVIDKYPDNPRYIRELQQLNLVNNETNSKLHDALVEQKKCFDYAWNKISADAVSTRQSGHDLIKSLERLRKSKCRNVVNPQVNCQAVDDNESKNLYKNYKSNVLQRHKNGNVYLEDAITCAERTVAAWFSKVEEFKNRVISIKKRL